ncbi:leucine-rich repeat flightless-interacting protein 1 isoform X6 [Dasypus novemcinctus]|uniref:leucine-rich repeat flightless-interacting protein 1 isoform X6 n=1 Tax=Dasypus novemcinctus TaxID=9361 RepID=UPI00265E81DE|nr:leucine-rich repeat flightless-interacting protein 1 isoform X6 [Dasypus novemcinctus]
MDMGTQGSGRKRLPNRERLTAEDDALNQIAREAEARLAAKRAARAEAREIRMKELERQQKEIYQVQKKYYGLDTKWGDIEQWMEDSERYSRRSRRSTSASDEDERVSVSSRGSLRSQPDLEYGGAYAWTNGYDGELYGPQSLNRRSGRTSSLSSDSRFSTWASPRGEKLGLPCSDFGLPSSSLASRSPSAQNGTRPSEYSGHLNSSSRASSRASSARASPVVEEKPEKDFTEKGSRNMPSLSAATLASLGGTSSRRGSGDTSISMDTEASIREIKELNELKDQIQDVEGKYMQGLKEMKDSLAEVEEKYKKAMVSNAQLDNEKTNFMYQVDTLKDMLLELEEQLAESRRQYEEKNKEFEREKHAHSILQFQFAEVKDALKQREEMLEEIRQLQQKQASFIREISDLQETIEWKDKKIGALERQKAFFDSIRSERDDLREEVAMLKEELKKHGIILNSEVATNGETSDALNNVGYQGFTKMTKEELNPLQSTGDGTLGRANEVEVKSEMVENVGKREIWPNTEREQHREDTGKDCVDVELSPPGENTEDQKTSQDSVPAPGTLVNAECEQVQSHILENTSFLHNTGQIESGLAEPGDRPGASLEQPRCSSGNESEIPGPVPGQGSYNDLAVENESKESAERQETDKQEDFKAGSGEVSTSQESVPLQLSEDERVSPGEPSLSSTDSMAEAGGADVGEQVGTRAPSPPECSDGPASHDGLRRLDVLEESDPSTAHSSEKELSTQEVAEPTEAPMPRESNEEEDGDAELMDERPSQTEVQSIPCSPTAPSDHQEGTGTRMVDPESEPLDLRDAGEGKGDLQGEALDSSQKKAKNKKRKNKKKKTPVSAETLKDVEKELPSQNAGPSEVQGEEQVKFTDTKPAVEAQNEVAENPNQEIVTGVGENVHCPGNPDIELNGETKVGKVLAKGDTLDFEEDTIQSPDTNAAEKEGDGGVVEVHAEKDAADQSRPSGPDTGDDTRSSSSPLTTQSPSWETNAGSLTGGREKCAATEHPGETVREALDSVGLENADPSAPAGAWGDPESENKEEARSRNEPGKSKEDCALS